MGDFMRIKTFAQTKKYTGNYLMDRTVIVVDVLRATSSIIWACRNGANGSFPSAMREKAPPSPPGWEIASWLENGAA